METDKANVRVDLGRKVECIPDRKQCCDTSQNITGAYINQYLETENVMNELSHLQSSEPYVFSDISKDAVLQTSIGKVSHLLHSGLPEIQTRFALLRKTSVQESEVTTLEKGSRSNVNASSGMPQTFLTGQMFPDIRGTLTDCELSMNTAQTSQSRTYPELKKRLSSTGPPILSTTTSGVRMSQNLLTGLQIPSDTINNNLSIFESFTNIAQYSSNPEAKDDFFPHELDLVENPRITQSLPQMMKRKCILDLIEEKSTAMTTSDGAYLPRDTFMMSPSEDFASLGFSVTENHNSSDSEFPDKIVLTLDHTVNSDDPSEFTVTTNYDSGDSEDEKLTVHFENPLHMNMMEKTFTCDVCQTIFDTAFKLRRHMIKHSDIRPYKCVLCKYAAKEKQRLIDHMLVHTNEKPYKCHMCDFSSRRSRTLKKHLRTHTSDITLDSENRFEPKSQKQKVPRLLTCDQCGQNFHHLKLFKKHLTKHFAKHSTYDIPQGYQLPEVVVRLRKLEDDDIQVRKNSKSFLDITEENSKWHHPQRAFVKLYKIDHLIEDKCPSEPRQNFCSVRSLKQHLSECDHEKHSLSTIPQGCQHHEDMIKLHKVDDMNMQVRQKLKSLVGTSDEKIKWHEPQRAVVKLYRIDHMIEDEYWRRHMPMLDLNKMTSPLS